MSEEGTDLWATHNGYVSITPIHLDMTSYAVMDDLQALGLESMQPGRDERGGDSGS